MHPPIHKRVAKLRIVCLKKCCNRKKLRGLKMENKNSSKNMESGDQLVISYELLQLMEWIVENDSEALKKIIARALKRGFDDQLKQSQSFKELYTVEEMQNSIIDFVLLLETLLLESTNEEEVNKVIQKNLMPAIDHVDTNNCDLSTLKSSISVATSKLQRNSKENVQEVFLKELLKRWKPAKNSISN